MSSPPIKRIWVVLFWIDPTNKEVGTCIPLHSLTKTFDFFVDAKNYAAYHATKHTVRAGITHHWIGDPNSSDYEGNDGGIMPCCQ